MQGASNQMAKVPTYQVVRNTQKLEDHYANLLRRCGRNLVEAKRVHALISQRGYDATTFMANVIVQTYGRCGSVDDAWKVFSKIQNRNVFSWNIIIAAFAQNGHSHSSVNLFWEMVTQERLLPTRVTFVNVLSNLTDLEKVKHIHSHAISCGFASDLLVATALLNMYGKCRSVVDAKKVFDSLRRKDVVAWTAMITAYAQNGHCEDALELYKLMDPEGVQPNVYTFSIVIDACSELGRLSDGLEIHSRIAACGMESSVVVCNSLINMYSSCKLVSEAERVFHKLPSKSSSFSWNSMIAAYAHNGYPYKAIELYREMRESVVKPDPVTFINVLAACCTPADLETGVSVHQDANAAGFVSYIVLSSALVTMYGKCGKLDEARKLFENMKEKDQVAWNAVITAHAQNGHGEEAMSFYRRMCCSSTRPNEATFISVLEACSTVQQGKMVEQHITDSGISSVMISTAIVNMYSKCGSLDDARAAFDKMRLKNAVAWMNMITAYVRHGCSGQALDLFLEMALEGFKPDEVVFISILNSCSHQGKLEEGLSHFVSMIQDYDLIPRVEHYGCLIDLLGRGGHIENAEELVNRMPFEPDSRALSSLLGSCRLHSDENRGEATAQRVLRIEPQQSANYVTLSGLYLT